MQHCGYFVVSGKRMLHLSSPRPSRLIALDISNICLGTSDVHALSYCMDTYGHYLCSDAWLVWVWGCPSCIYDAGKGDSFTVPWHVTNNDGDIVAIWAYLSTQDCLGCVALVGMEGITHSINSSIR